MIGLNVKARVCVRPSCHTHSKLQHLVNDLFPLSRIAFHVLNQHEGSSTEIVRLHLPKAILQHPTKARDQAPPGASRAHTSWLSRLVKLQAETCDFSTHTRRDKGK